MNGFDNNDHNNDGYDSDPTTNYDNTNVTDFNSILNNTDTAEPDNTEYTDYQNIASYDSEPDSYGYDNNYTFNNSPEYPMASDTNEYFNTNDSFGFSQTEGNYDNSTYGYGGTEYPDQASLNLDFNTQSPADVTVHVSNNDFTAVDDNYAEATESTLNSLKDELTPAELEDLKREKAARRRKRMLREKRRRERRRQAIIRCSLLLIAVILVIVIIVKIFAGIGGLIKNSKKHNKKTTETITTEATTTEEPVANIDESIVAKELPETREEALTILKEQGETDSDIKNIVENEAVYPDIMLKHLAINSELIDFALNYPAKISIPFDGDFSVDTDTTEVPFFLEYDQEWGYADYGSSVLGLNGAAPSCLSMAYVYLTGDGSKNPIIIGDFSMEKGYLSEDGYTDYKLMTEGAEELGLESNELDIDKDNLIAALEEGNAIICAVVSGDFTKDKSYIVISDYRNGFFYVNDPTSRARSQVGWDYKRLSSQIASAWSLKRGSAPISTGNDTDSTDGITDGTSTDETGSVEAADGTDNADTNETDNNSQTDGDYDGIAE